ncbi:MAG: cadmium-translocating P-type ATPase [Gemmatimonadaceae bacterium]|nr:cadmium-translocating P-type ATPase [Gemmatimonadaceae bacterium]
MRPFIAPAVAALVLSVGAALAAAGVAPAWRTATWNAGLVLTGAPLVWRTVRHAAAGHFATDIVATLAIVGALLLGQPVAGLIVVIMQTGGEGLERYAEGKASEAVRALEDAAPRLAHRVVDSEIHDIPAEQVAVEDTLLVRPGELVPCDAEVLDGTSHLDTSRLTGEPIPRRAGAGARLMSGSVNLEGSLTVRATAVAGESQYARIVELVRRAQASKSPLQRLAERYAVWFTPLTLGVCAAAYLLTGDALRVLAVLVVATPCPLILATPVAIIGGINRAATQHIIVRNGAALEQLAAPTVAVFDKTGTITIGQPAVERVHALPPHTTRDVLRLAGSLEQSSSHLLARTVVQAARDAQVPLVMPRDVVELPGRGIVGSVDGRHVAVGGRALIGEMAPAIAAAIERMNHGARLQAFVAVDGALAAVIEYADQLRPGLAPFLAELDRLGVRRTLLLSGDHPEPTRAVADQVGIDEVESDLLPEDKVAIVRRLVADGESVLMVGDGTNDAPALSSATVGVALAGQAGRITAEAADVVILDDELRRVADAIRVSRRTLRIARQSIVVGLGLSGAAMIVAAFGYIPPAIGALLQELIDAAVILNALRASR